MGKLICIEGIDGSGKTTQALMLLQCLQDKGITSIYKHFPDYTTPTGKLINDKLHGRTEMSNKTLSDLYVKNRSESNIRELVNAYDYVIVDRYAISNMAYQIPLYELNETYDVGIDDKIVFDSIFNMYNKEFVINGIPYPDKIYWLNVGPKEALQHMTDANRKKDLYECDTEKQRSAYMTYKHLSFILPHYYCIEAENRSKNAIHGDIVHRLHLT